MASARWTIRIGICVAVSSVLTLAGFVFPSPSWAAGPAACIATTPASSPPALNFGGQAVGIQTPQSLTVTITSCGAGDLTIFDDFTTGPDGGDFSRQTDTCYGATLNSTTPESCTVTIAFTPSTPARSENATLQIDDDAANTPQSVSLLGQGQSASFSITPAAVYFPPGTIGVQSSQAKTITVQVVGSVEGLVNDDYATGTYANDFQGPSGSGDDHCYGQSLPTSPVRFSCTIRVWFTPSTNSRECAPLRFDDNAANSPQFVALCGNIRKPGAPTTAKAVTRKTSAKNASITVTYKAPQSNGGASITRFTATCKSSNHGVTKTAHINGGTARPIVVAGVTTKKTYTCTVTATNPVGTSVPSAASKKIVAGS